MATVSTWTNVAVAMQSALATAITISGITKANPGVVTYTGTDPSNGDYILLPDILGMFQLNERAVRAANVNAGANTLELEGVDTTLFDTFVSGTGQVITFGTTFSTLTTLNASGGEAAEIDTTTIHDNVDKIEYGNFSAIQYSFGSQWDPGDAALVALYAASQVKAKRAVRFTWPNGRKAVFYGAVAYSGVPGGSAKALVESPVKITSRGFPTYYSS